MLEPNSLAVIAGLFQHGSRIRCCRHDIGKISFQLRKTPQP
jgi:hypothetical protein